VKGQVALVTGASRGIGAACARLLAEAGAQVALLGRDVAALDQAARGIPDALVLRADVTDEAAVNAAVRETEARFGRLDILVTAAGVNGPMGRTLWEVPVEEAEAVMAANLRGTLLPMRAALPGMIARGHGRLIAIGGTFALRGRRFRTAYSASKFALRGLVRSLAWEAGPHGITANTVCPGLTRTDRAARAIAERAAAEGIAEAQAEAAMMRETALGLIVEPEDVAHAVLFLAGPGGRRITGQDIVVDSGASA
jgi:NAD(P)-dependent dehydrogenase (short-subunit alcohol dehydrogenase family)